METLETTTTNQGVRLSIAEVNIQGICYTEEPNLIKIPTSCTELLKHVIKLFALL